MSATPPIQVGDWVRLNARLRRQERSHGKAQVKAFYPGIEGGVRLQTPLAGYYSWNLKDLELYRPRKRP